MNLLQQQARWVEHEQHVEEARERRNSVSAVAAREGAKYTEALAAHRAAVEEAALAGDELPQDQPEPPDPAIDRALKSAIHEQDVLREHGQKLRGVLTPDVEAEARARWAARRDELAEAVTLLDEAAKDLRADARVVSECRAAADNQKAAIPRPNGGERTETQWTTEDLIAVVQQEADPFALTPLHRPEARILDGHGAPESTPPAGAGRGRQYGFISAR